MASDATLERAYPYRAGWRVIGCGVLMFGTMGAAATALIPSGYEKIENGAMPVGVAMMVGGLFGLPLLFMALSGLISGVRETVAPPRIRVTPTALLLPPGLRGVPEKDEDGVTKPGAAPPHPDEIPFAAIRSIRREGPVNPGTHKLVIAHDLAPVPLLVEQYMMNWGDFDELETVLRSAIPAAFAPAPPPAGPPTGA